MNVIQTAMAVAKVVSSLRSLAEDHPEIAAAVDDLIDVLEDSESPAVRILGEQVRNFLNIPDDIDGDVD